MSQVSFTGDARAISRYFERFQRLVAAGRVESPEMEELGNLMVLKGNTILVERLPRVEMKTSSGIIIPSTNGYKETHADKVTDFGIVLMTGVGEVLEDGTRAEMEVKPGDVILLPNSVYWYSPFGTLKNYEANSIGLTRDSAALMVFTDYQKAFEVLNG